MHIVKEMHCNQGQVMKLICNQTSQKVLQLKSISTTYILRYKMTNLWLLEKNLTLPQTLRIEKPGQLVFRCPISKP